MTHQFQHPLGKRFLKQVGQLFQSPDAYILRDSSIVFVCGGPINEARMRPRFIEYAETELLHLRIFLAEVAEKDFVTNEDVGVHNVAEFEELIGAVSDCLIIFPESAGSFAELGYFSKHVELRKKILVVNDLSLQGSDSFILRGPIHLIDSESKFGPTIQISYGDDADFKAVKQRLENRVVGKRRRKFEVQKYADLDTRKAFFAIFEIIRLFEVMTLEAIEYAFKSVFAHVNPTHLKQLLSILVAAGLVRRGGKDDEYFCVNRKAKPFMEFDGFPEATFRLQLTDFYQTEFPEIAQIVGRLS